MSRQVRKPRPNGQNERIAPGQESVWGYPRPPLLEPVSEHVRIVFGDRTIVESTQALRVLETSHPPTIYVPEADVVQGVLIAAMHRSFCEWKGVAHYYDVVADTCRVGQAAWYYPSPKAEYAKLTNHVSFYPSKMQACYLNDELVTSQPGDFYGGWITSKIVGPFKGGPGTSGW